MSNVFGLGSQIISRLDSQLTTLQSVVWASAAMGPNAENLKLPIAFVQPGQAQGDDDSDESDKTREKQLWQVGLRVEVDPGAVAAAAGEVTMGQLIYQTIVALRGWAHGIAGTGKLAYLSRTEMQYPPGSGYGEVWLTFDAVVVTRRT